MSFNVSAHLRVVLAAALILSASACVSLGGGSASKSGSTLSWLVGDAEKRDGFLPTWLDRDGARLWMEIPAPTGERGECVQLLHVAGLSTGLGSNPVGLDRGQLGGARLVSLRRVGERVLFELPNLRFRADTDNVDEARAARESFASSVLWATDASHVFDDGRAIIHLTPFLLRDAHDVIGTLSATNQGSFSLDADRSIVEPSACLVFPDNLEFEATLTFSGSNPGQHVASTAPLGKAVTLVQHQSFIRLPDDNYTPRDFDPRSGAFGTSFTDLAAPLDTDLTTRYAIRHRLERGGEPIVYYIDRGAPEPVRSALLDGARWWAEAFAAAGFPDMYRVEVLPADAHPLDVRYNVVQWVHRSTRGWSYGNAIHDPRTGEIIKGHVSLGSLRVRQDRRLFEGLLGTSATGTGDANDPIELSLARIRQLAAHEIGHTLGLSHNFAASTYDDRASVMDYPAPLVRARANGTIDVSRAYGVGLGSWDIQAIQWLYTTYADATTERAGLARILDDGARAGRIYMSDRDARAPGSAHPLANLWDNGSDPIAALENALAVRRIAIANFGLDNLPEGAPIAELEEVFVPVYLHHRYQIDAALKSVGGLNYGYAIHDGNTSVNNVVRDVDDATQMRALHALFDALRPEVLDIPDHVLQHLVPRPPGVSESREQLATRTAPGFDALGAASTAARPILDGLLVPERLHRLEDAARRDPSRIVTPAEILRVFESLVNGSAITEGNAIPPQSERLSAIARVVAFDAVEALIQRSGDGRLRPSARAAIDATLTRIHATTRSTQPTPRGNRHAETAAAIHARLSRWFARAPGASPATSRAASLPPGSPIGTEALCGCSLGLH